MAEDSFKNTLFALVLFVAFSWLIITVAVDFGAEYGRSSDEIGNGSLSKIGFESTANTIEGSASVYRSRFEI
jgi:hypothetical protein